MQLMDKFSDFLPPNIMLPRDRLRKIIDQSLQYQISNCTYHVVSNESPVSESGESSCSDFGKYQSLSLLADHKYN